jgi:hypothetical protein
VPVGGHVVQPSGEPTQLGGEDQADRDRVPVLPRVLLAALDRVPERVPVVEDLPQPGLLEIHAHHVRLHSDLALDQLTEHVAAWIHR